MWISVDVRSHTPMYQQIIDAIKEQIARGYVKPGDRLLTVRELATSLSLNHNTVAKAYQELEREHVIELVRGRGTFVSAPSDIPDINNRKRDLKEALKKWLVDAHHLRIPDNEILSMFQELFTEFHDKPGGEQ
ncbi:GntR family transcriptional regulator [Alicyclobacillus curvatus]|jgi:GntR family transcriptional regulator|nr:GntR family transcriptional regulator [Alicyclobacillus curvatus]